MKNFGRGGFETRPYKIGIVIILFALILPFLSFAHPGRLNIADITDATATGINMSDIPFPDGCRADLMLKALRLAAKYLRDPDAQIRNDLLYRTQAERLRAAAAELEQQKADAKFVEEIINGCKSLFVEEGK